MLSTRTQILQLPKTTTAYPWATQIIITFSINLACQVSPLEDTLASTKGQCATANCRTQQQLSTPHLKSSITNAQTHVNRLCERQLRALLSLPQTVYPLPNWQVAFRCGWTSGCWIILKTGVLVWTSRR